MTIKTKSIYDPIEPDDGERILVTRYWPRNRSRVRLDLSKLDQGWFRSLAPSPELLYEWKHELISWADFTLQYRMQMICNESHDINLLSSCARHETITLLCFEPEGDPHCHRHILKQLIEDATRS